MFSLPCHSEPKHDSVTCLGTSRASVCMASPAHSAAILKIPPPARQLADSLCHLQGHQGTTHLAVHLLECRQMFRDNFQVIRESIKRPRHAPDAFPVQGRSENLSSPGLTPHCQCGTSGSRGKCQSLQETMPLRPLLTHQGSQVGMYLVAWSLKMLSNIASPVPGVQEPLPWTSLQQDKVPEFRHSD